ncbi:excinuclease ABC subunit UvrC [Candidatus Cryosericum hinesii]|jgi:excinuclease ABC subunit C|uniref:Excinuclease ABC subunit UvrC n=2 Tax=Candidatus Cryosericum hinesii TaxID=2290915 RepID=A0A398DNS5_9BACT|nr:excinuclease ABC subunit UvrC [Candidatus Cryosericum hinesii]RIE13727.1 excinuclease ABC subunit UvrC [Candidatus Cryosericum hinesii]RIE14196.1 excinuclease ABC subunit UvrC [Candidatus Cryosericum hinesii]
MPGVYVIRDSSDRIIYVGKAKNLRKRVESYFRNDLNPKTRSMVSNARFFSFITAGHEDQALVLESNFIKCYKPHYNIQLIDGKSYPLIELTGEAFSILRKTRRVTTARNRYFGPYPKSGLLNLGLDSLRRAFPVRTCHRRIDPAKPTKPCLDFDLGLCLAPCGNRCSQDEYAEVVQNLSAFLNGKMRTLLRQLENSMDQASRSQQYERAVRYRDSCLALKGLFERYAVFAPRVRDMDVFAFHQQGNLVAVVRQALREGRLIASTEFIYDLKGKGTLDPVMRADLIIDFYDRFHVAAPARIAVDAVGAEATIVRERLREALGAAISLASPRSTETSRLLRFATENAEQKLIASTRASDIPAQLSVLKAVLDLERMPVRIEGYDVSNISGKDATVSMVVFVAGKPAKDQYRLFNMHSLDTPNDPAMLAEALARRFARWSDITFGDPANLLLIDGGLSQLGAVCAVRDNAGVNVPVVGIAKKEELLYREGTLEPVRLSHDSGALLLLMAVRDEAHRFGKREFHKRHERPLKHR